MNRIILIVLMLGLGGYKIYASDYEAKKSTYMVTISTMFYLSSTTAYDPMWYHVYAKQIEVMQLHNLKDETWDIFIIDPKKVHIKYGPPAKKQP